MRYFIVFILMLLLSCKHKKGKETGSLEVLTKYCKYKKGYKFDISSTCKLFKNGVEIQSSEKSKLIFQNLSFGEYYIEYTTIYNERKRLDFKINETMKNIHYCVDTISYGNDQNILLIDELKTNEKLLLQYNVIGCFHGDNKKLEIKRTVTDYVLSYLDKKYTLSKKQLQLFREFEIELYKNHSNLCSTIDTYHIGIFKSEKIFTINDGSCKWSGFPNLIELLKLE